MTVTREIHLASRPTGWPTHGNFRLVKTELPAPGAGEVLLRNMFMSVDPYMRGRMNDRASYLPPFKLDKPLEGSAVGEVVESNAGDLVPGDLVLHDYGWREHAVVNARVLHKLSLIEGVSPSHFLGALGMTALTAYVGLLDMANFKAGDTVFVSGAAGAVGSMAGQFAKLLGAKRAIGSAGSAKKVSHVVHDLGFDAAFNYRDGNVAGQLAAAAPDGIDVYFDNVGGDHLEAALGTLTNYGRVALCGSISQYNTKTMTGPANFYLAMIKRLSLRGFIVSDHFHRFPAMIAPASEWLRSGKLVAKETIVDSLDNAVDAFLGMLRGTNRGKALVRLS